ncbi:MAG: Hsp20/alpha crystallin family protein [Bacteroidota bacterium]
MALIKRPEWPLLATTNWLTDFFDNERFFDSEWLRRTQVVPAVNVDEKDKEFEIQMAAPGMKKSDFKITTEDSILTISSEKEERSEEKDKDMMRREFNYSSFMRSFNLPENCMEDKIAAHYEDGILKVTIPKKTPTKEKLARPIEVR